MLNGMIQHILKLLTLRHNGKGLSSPIETSIFFLVIIILSRILYLALWGKDDDLTMSIIFSVVVNIAFFFIGKTFLTIEQLNGLLLISIGVGVFRIILGAFPMAMMLLFILEIAAIIGVINKLKKPT